MARRSYILKGLGELSSEPGSGTERVKVLTNWLEGSPRAAMEFEVTPVGLLCLFTQF